MRTAEIAEKVRDRVQILLPQALSGSLIDPPGGKINQKKKAPPGEAELETAEDEDLKNEAAEDKEEEEGKTAGAEADPNSQVPEEEDLSRYGHSIKLIQALPSVLDPESSLGPTFSDCHWWWVHRQVGLHAAIHVKNFLKNLDSLEAGNLVPKACHKLNKTCRPCQARLAEST